MTMRPQYRIAVTGSRLLAILASASLLGYAGSVPAQGDTANAEAGLAPLRQARDALMGAADFVAAEDLARQAVDASAEAGDPLLGHDLIQYAHVNAVLQKFAEAEELYLRSIEEISLTEGVDSPTLAIAYQSLGRSYVNERRFFEAIDAFESARDISRRNEGLLNLDQTSIIDDLTMANLGNGNTIEARDLQLERLQLAIRRFGEDDARLIPFHTQLGEYLNSSRLRGSAREQFVRVLELGETSFGASSPQAIAALTRIVGIDLLLNRDEGAAERLAVAIESAEALADPDRAQALVALGDYSLVHEGPAAAAARYQAAYALLAGLDGIDADGIFASPAPLNLVPPLDRVDRNRRSDPWAWGELTMLFDVSADGRPSNVGIETMEPMDESLGNDYIRRIRETYFRPRLLDGVPVGTAATRYTHSFRYYVDVDD